ncbi:DUF4388 domain-containing protein [bacterium]|nr:DUF4388 domain-containing protein [candidate division CSSED10-310 bacterium]
MGNQTNVTSDGPQRRLHEKTRTASEQLRVRHGKLSERTVSELLFFAFTTDMDGTLACSHQGITKTLRFKSGKLIDARSNDPHDSPQWILYEMGKLDRGFTSNDAMMDQDQQSGQTIKLLSDQIRQGIMQPNEIDEFMHRRVRRILHDLMAWREGEYVLELSKLPRTDPPLKVHRSIPEMILREMKTAPDPVGLKEMIENPGLKVEQGAETVNKINLTAIEQRILKATSKVNTIQAVSKEMGLGLEATSRILLGLGAVGLIRIFFSKKQRKPELKPDQTPTEPAVPETSDAVEEMPEKKDDDLESLIKDEPFKTTFIRDIKTEEQAKYYLIELIQLSFEWNPYTFLGLDNHCKDTEIEQIYDQSVKFITSLNRFEEKSVKDMIASVMALLEEARTILLNNTLRARFDTLNSVVDVQKKIHLGSKEHRKGLQAFKDKRLPLALVHIKFAAFLEPRNSEYQYKLIYLMAQNPRLWALARLLQIHCLDRFGTNPNIIALSGLLYHRSGDKIKARSEYQRALSMDSEHELARHGMAIIDRLTGRR